MTKAQLITVVAKQAHLPRRAASDAIDSFLSEVMRSLQKGDKVVISGFGTFKVDVVDDKEVVPFGDESKRKVVKKHRVVNFQTGKPLRTMVW